MSTRFSQAQQNIIDDLKAGAVIHAYQSSARSSPGLRTFISNKTKKSKTLRLATFFKLAKNKVIEREKPLDWDDWAGTWKLAK